MGGSGADFYSAEGKEVDPLEAYTADVQQEKEEKQEKEEQLAKLYDPRESDLKRGVMGRLKRSKLKIGLSVVAGGILGAGAMVGADTIGIGKPGYALFVGLAPLIITGMIGLVRMKGDHELADECEQAKDSGSVTEMAKVIQKLQAKYPDQTTTVTTSAAEQQGVTGELEDAANSAAAAGGDKTIEEGLDTAKETSNPVVEKVGIGARIKSAFNRAADDSTDSEVSDTVLQSDAVNKGDDEDDAL